MKKRKLKMKLVRKSRTSEKLFKAQVRISELEQQLQEKQDLLQKSWEKLGKIQADSQRCELIAVFTEDNRMRSIKRLCAGSTFDSAVKAFIDAKGMWKEEEEV